MNDFKDALIRHLEEMAFFFEYHEANPFKIRAYQKAVEILSGLSESVLQKKIKDQSLTEFKGIGKGILSIADEFLKTKTSLEWKEARGELPLSLLELNELQGLGAKKI